MLRIWGGEGQREKERKGKVKGREVYDPRVEDFNRKLGNVMIRKGGRDPKTIEFQGQALGG